MFYIVSVDKDYKQTANSFVHTWCDTTDISEAIKIFKQEIKLDFDVKQTKCK